MNNTLYRLRIHADTLIVEPNMWKKQLGQFFSVWPREFTAEKLWPFLLDVHSAAAAPSCAACFSDGSVP